MTPAPIFDSFLTDGDLGSRLASMTTHGRLRSACVGLQIDGRRLFAAAREGIQSGPGEAENHLVPATCLAKPLTATLLAAAACSHHLDWSDEIGFVLGLTGPWKDKLAGISLASLLNHTHGLDAPTVPQLPRTHDGFVDVEALCGQLAVTPLNAPGRLHSYSSTGAWFAGALLERLSGRPYSKLLGEQQLWPASRGSNPVYTAGVCPASGAELELTVSEWLSFLAFHLADSPVGTDGALAQTVASLRADPVALPGWSPSEQGACLGWKHYGTSWFGHNSNTPGSSALLRFSPEQNIAIVIEASADTAFIVLAGLFGTALPEFTHLRPPRLLSPEQRAALLLERYTGTYAQSQSRLGVGTDSQGSLHLSVAMQGSQDTTAARPLRAAEDEIFLPESQVSELPFIQFVEPLPSRTFEYVWNGKQLWRRVAHQ